MIIGNKRRGTNSVFPLPVGEDARRAGEAPHQASPPSPSGRRVLRVLVVFSYLFTILSFHLALAKTPLPPKAVKGPMVNDLPVPFNLQAVTLNKGVTLTWNWQPPEALPSFNDFGYEVRRNDGRTSMVSETTFGDFDLAWGTYSYKVRVVGGARFKGKHINHVSEWSEPAQIIIKVSCTAAPTISLLVEPTRNSYSQVAALRMHLKGNAQVPAGCRLGQVQYHIDSGTGLNHAGPLPVDLKGRFDTFVNAVEPEDEVPAGVATFTVTASAEDEVGPVTSDAFTINIELGNKFAPRSY